MSPDRDARFTPEDPDDDFDEEEAPRSIFSATWFRVVLVLLGLGVVGAVAVPYVLDVVNPSLEPKIATAPSAPREAPAPMPSQSTASAAPTSASPSSSAPLAAAPSTPASAVETAKPVASPESATSRVSSAPAPASTAPAAVAPAKKEFAREAAKSDASQRTLAQAAPAEKPAAKKSAASARATDNGDYFVQVGAYKDQAMAMNVAARLRQQNYSVVESTVRVGASGGAGAARPAPPAPAPVAVVAPPAPLAPRTATPSTPDRYDVIVSGASPADMNARLTAKGLASEPAGEGVRIRPSLPLRDAVALSKDLGSEGFRVQVRRAGAADPAPVAAPPPAPVAATRPVVSTSDGDGGQILHRVRVGGFPDRAAAQVALRELQEKGYQPFIAKGRE